MGKIFCIMGKSGSGKDTIYNRILNNNRNIKLYPIIPYTTRPMRIGEIDGKTYHFVTDDEIRSLQKSEKVIEIRSYEYVNGKIYYATVENDSIDLEKKNYLYITTPDAYRNIRDFYGVEKVIPLYVWVPDGIRLKRSLEREIAEKNPNYMELCRRFISDTMDFGESELSGIDKRHRFLNDDIYVVVEKILTCIEIEIEKRE